MRWNLHRRLAVAALALAAVVTAIAGSRVWRARQPLDAADSQPDPSPAASSTGQAADLERLVLAAQMRPRDAALPLAAGSMAADLGQYGEALHWFREAAARDPKLLPAITGQGQVWLELNRPGPAVAAYERALRLAPDEPGIHLELARAYTYLRDFDAALGHAREAARRNPSNPEAQRALSHIFLETLEVDAAHASAERACQLGPSDAENWTTLGYALLRNRQFAPAESALRHALRLDAGHGMANVLLAKTLVEGRKSQEADREAFALLARARTLDPYNAQALLQQGQILVRAGNLSLAISILRRAREWEPRDPDILLTLGQALVKGGQGEEGVRVLTAGQKLPQRGISFSGLEEQAQRSSDPALIERLADLYRRHGMYDSAIHVLERALSRHPGSGQLRRRLQAASGDAHANQPSLGRSVSKL